MNRREEKRLAKEARKLKAGWNAKMKAEAAARNSTKPVVTCTPREAAPKVVTPIEEDSPRDENEPFDSAANPEPDFIELDDFASIAEEQQNADRFDPAVFRALCATAIKEGAISRQDFIATFEVVIPRDVDTSIEAWSLPRPNIRRAILNEFSMYSVDRFSGSKLPWRHSQCGQSEEVPEPQG